MRKLVLTLIASGIFIHSGIAQTLFTYGNNSVTKDEFLKVYKKNSINKSPDFSEAALREYLDLYSLFRMKVREAEVQQIDTIANLQYDIDNYKKQLARTYLTDEKVTNDLIQEAYNRMKEEVHVSHILVMVPLMATGVDTLAPYKKIDSIYNAITKKKADFAQLAKEFTDDRSSKDNGGDIGYLTALQTIYPFENAMYNTPVGKVSAPFRTQFGYHIVKVLDRRPARGEIKVAQILISAPKSRGEEGIAQARRRIDSATVALKKGVPFADVVKQFSDDKFSVENNGELAPFGVGKMTPAYEDAAFALKKPGDISEPVQTEYGFHIIKLIERYPLKPIDSLRPFIKRKIDNDSRASVARESFINGIKARNNFKEYPQNFDEVSKALISRIVDTGKNANSFQVKDFASMNKPLFTLAGNTYNQNDFISYAEKVTRGKLNGPKQAVLKDIYNLYVNNVATDFEEQHLIDTRPEFKALLNEYKDGIMLFELMDRNVWSKASRDTVGLKDFYENNKSKYMWEPGFTGSVYRFKNEDAMKQGVKLLQAGKMTDEEILKQINTEANGDALTVQRGHFEFAKFNEVPRTSIVKGKVTEVKKNADGTYTAVRVENVFNTPSQKSLDDAKGYVVAEYQDYLEKEWNRKMREKYPLKVNEQVFTSMVKK
jgi:peptidyl-prolyl cis-trans isomerase SurA